MFKSVKKGGVLFRVVYKKIKIGFTRGDKRKEALIEAKVFWLECGKFLKVSR